MQRRYVAALATIGLLRHSAGKVRFAPADLLSNLQRFSQPLLP